jgi:hypothetical protein
MWVLFLIVVHNSVPTDIPGKIALEFKTEQQCQEALKTMIFWSKFHWFNTEGKCYAKNKMDPNLLKDLHK